jgi:hypothetical protein
MQRQRVFRLAFQCGAIRALGGIDVASLVRCNSLLR